MKRKSLKRKNRKVPNPFQKIVSSSVKYAVVDGYLGVVAVNHKKSKFWNKKGK